MSEYNIQMNKYNALNAEYDQLYPQPMKHASTHAKDGDDPITPSMIGTYNKTEIDTALQNKADLGTVYSKSETLSDTTKTLFGLDATAVPDDALALLSRLHKGLGNEYVWEKLLAGKKATYADAINGLGIRLFQVSTTADTTDILYGDTVKVENGVIVIDNPSTLTLSYNTAVTGDAGVSSASLSVLANKYVSVPTSGTTGYAGTVIYITSCGTAKAQDSSSRQYYVAASSTQGYKLEITDGFDSFGYVNSPDPNAYPPAVSDGYTYKALGQLGAKVQIATGSYVGTGTYGESNPNSLTFDFVPKIVIVYQSGSGLVPINLAWNGSFLYIQDQGMCYVNSTATTNAVWFSLIGSTLSWYAGDAIPQLNATDITYRYIAI